MRGFKSSDNPADTAWLRLMYGYGSQVDVDVVTGWWTSQYLAGEVTLAAAQRNVERAQRALVEIKQKRERQEGRTRAAAK